MVVEALGVADSSPLYQSRVDVAVGDPGLCWIRVFVVNRCKSRYKLHRCRYGEVEAGLDNLASNASGARAQQPSSARSKPIHKSMF